jgi:hypothetical protein
MLYTVTPDDVASNWRHTRQPEAVGDNELTQGAIAPEGEQQSITGAVPRFTGWPSWSAGAKGQNEDRD